jgi:predicted amino acid dehydrogenase
VVDFVASRHAAGTSFKPGTFAARLLSLLPCPREAVIEELERTDWLVLTQETKTALRGARLVITATSATGAMIGPKDLRPHAVVCDVSRPANVSREVTAARPDVLVIDGGIIATPAKSRLSQFGLGAGLVYACMAETMMLTLAGHLRNTSIGTDLAPETLQLLRSLADRYGFEVARLRSFGQPVEE